MSKTRKSVVFSSVSKFGSIATSLVLVVVVTRWLMPAEIGAFAVAYAIVSLLEPIRQLQLTAYMIQVPALERGVIRAVHFVGWMMNLLVVTVAIATALLLIGVFDQAEIGRMLLIMTPTFIIGTLVQPALGLLNREMRFGLVAGVEISGAVAKAAATIGLLFMGLRAEALAIGIVVEICAKLAFLTRVDRTIAFAWPSRAGAGDIWQYCLKYTGAELVNRATMALTDIAIGSFLGLAAAGFYNRASVLVRNLRSGIEGAIVPVALAAFGKSNREEPGVLKRDYLVGISLLTGITWPALAVFIALAEPMILTFYGERWVATIYLSQVLCGGAIIHATTAMAPALLASTGKVHSLLIRNLSTSIPRLLILLVTVQYNLSFVVWGWFASILIHFAITQSLLRREVGIDLFDTAASLWRSAVVALVSALAAWAALELPLVSEQSSLIRLAAGLAIAGLVWLSAIFLARHPLGYEICKAVKNVRARVAARS